MSFKAAQAELEKKRELMTENPMKIICLVFKVEAAKLYFMQKLRRARLSRVLDL